MNFKPAFFTVSLMVVLGCLAFAQQPEEYSYRVGPQDLITISVFDVPELNITVRIEEDGSITLPLLGRVQAEGSTRFQLEKKLAEELEKKYLKNAQVTVFIKEYQSKMISIIGEVVKPGNFELLGKQSLLQVVSLAGGFKETAAGEVIILRQFKDGKNRHLSIKLEDLMIKGDADLNIPLRPGDIVNVPAEQFFDIYVFGQVKNPGRLQVKKDGAITLLKAIAQAGGFSDRARKGAVTITRRIDGKDMKTRVNVKKILDGKIPDIVLQNNDIVHVPESIL